MIPAEILWPHEACADAAAAAARAARLGEVDVEPLTVGYPQLSAALGRGPVVLRSAHGLIAVVASGRRRCRVVTPKERTQRVATAEVADAVVGTEDGTALGEIVPHLSARARRAVRDALLADRRVDAGWRVRPVPNAPARVLARSERLGRWLAVAVASHAAVYATFLALWVVVGGAAARGELDSAAVVIGVALLLALAGLRAAAVWSAGIVTVKAGVLLKRRIMGGVLGLDADALRRRGVGELLGVVLEAEALETLALAGGYSAVLAVAELAAAAIALAVGVRAVLLLALLASWIGGCVVVGIVYLRRRRTWSAERLALTHELVERMVGHRTRLAQEGPSRLDVAADELALSGYERRAAAMDRIGALLLAAAPRVWVVVSLAAAVVGVSGADHTVELAAAFGGVLLAFHGLEKLAAGVSQLADAAVAWERIGPLVTTAQADDARPPASSPSDGALVELRDASFAYGGHQVLQHVSLAVRPGDRLLLEGPSGAGKSTLAMLLCGLRQPSDGTVLGAGEVATAPQFHDNHVLSASLAFNLLLGRRWPPTVDDLQAAAELCEQLGLGPLLAAMPAGIEQPVGETGWQLSHGERSRLYIARALLSERPVVVLDESFAALDPEALRQTLGCVVQRATALVVIAHE